MKLPLTTIGLVIFVVALQIQVMRLEGRLDNYMHPPATVSAKDFRDCVSGSCVTYSNVGGASVPVAVVCGDGIHSWAPRDGVCYAADAPKVPNKVDSSVYYSVQ